MVRGWAIRLRAMAEHGKLDTARFEPMPSRQ
jgi:hypothetical protein